MLRCLKPGLGATLALTFALCAAQERVLLPSQDTHHGAAVLLPAYWFASAQASAAPAMVLLHGCGGVADGQGRLSSRTRDMATRLQAMGVAVLVPDSFTPRGQTELCTQRVGARTIDQTQRRRDALGALQWLAAQPGVDATRLGLLGWSNGGSTVLAASNQRHPEVRASATQASLAVAFYPGCEAELQRGYASAGPLLLLVGGADDWTAPGPCVALAQRASAPQPQIEVYADAYHGFDTSAPVRLRRDVPNGVHPGAGVHVGGNPQARSASAERLEQFVRAQWQLEAAEPGR
ncbi:MAG: dienelactone hydrolase family protein [Burkholderiales bacterium]